MVTRFRALAAGILVGASAMLSLDMSLFSRPPVITLKLSEDDGIAVVGTSIETRYRFVRRAQCNTISQAWIWKWIDEGTGNKRKYYIPLQASPVTLSDVSPVIQDFVVAVPLPPTVTPGQWFIRNKALDYCSMLAWMWGPSIRVSQDIPVKVLPLQETVH